MNYIAIDIETNGINLEQDDILLISAVKISNGKICDTFSRLVKPSRPQTEELELFTGITNKELESADSFENVMAEFEAFSKGCAVVSYDEFEYSFLREKGFKADKIVYLRNYLKKNYSQIQKYIADAVIIELGLEKQLKDYLKTPMFFKNTRLFYSLKISIIFMFVSNENPLM